MTFDNNQFMMEWPYKKIELSFFFSVLVLLDCLACVHHIECWSLIAILCKFFFLLLYLCVPSQFYLKLNVHVIYVIGWSIDIYFQLYACFFILSVFYSSLSLFFINFERKRNGLSVHNSVSIYTSNLECTWTKLI